jgi:hypothetical protein
MIRFKSFLSRAAIPCAVAILISSNTAQADTIGVNLGPALGYAILGVNGGSSPLITLSAVTVHGDVGLGPNVTLANNAPSEITGTLYQTTAGSATGPGLFGGGKVTKDLTSAAAAALAASTNFADNSLFAPNSTINGNVTTSTTINRVGALTVVDINGDINLNNNNLTINGNLGDNIIVNISGALTLTGTASIVLTGGLTSQNVVLNFFGGSGAPAFNTHVGDVVNGIVLAPHRDGQLDGTWNGELIFGYNNLTLLSDANVYGQTTPVGAPGVPLPSAALGGIGLFGLLAAGRRSRRQGAK